MPPYRRSARRRPAAMATGVNAARPVTSPRAKMCFTLVCCRSSVGINPYLSMQIPALSASSVAVFGDRPTAQSTASTGPTSLPSSAVSIRPSSVLCTDAGTTPVSSAMPLFCIVSISAVLSMVSKLRNILSLRTTTLVSLPRPESMPASSTAI